MLFKSKSGTFDFLIAGLGNPGMEYEKTRHNAGFSAVDIIAENCGAAFSKHKFEAVLADGEIASKRVLICKPQTYMNNSGNAVGKISSFYKIPADKIIVISDDIDLKVGTVRIRRKGSAGGHNGLKDIIAALGTEDFMRIKIGVGDRSDRDIDLKNHVLGRFSKEDAAIMEKSFKTAAAAVEEILNHGIESAMNLYSK